MPTTADRTADRDQQQARDDADERRDQRDEPDARVGDHVLAPRVLEQLRRTLDRRDRADLLDHEHRQHEERDERPRQTDERADDAADDARRAPRWPGARATRSRSRTAHGSNTCARAPAACIASPIVTGSPWRRLSAANTSAALKNTTTYVSSEVADDAEDPRERLRRALRAVVGDQRRPARRTRARRRAPTAPESSGSSGELLVVAQHVPRRLRQVDRVLQPSHGGPPRTDTSVGQGTVAARDRRSLDVAVRRLGRCRTRSAHVGPLRPRSRGCARRRARRRALRAGAGPGQPDRRPHRLPGRALPADRDRPRGADRVPAAFRRPGARALPRSRRRRRAAADGSGPRAGRPVGPIAATVALLGARGRPVRGLRRRDHVDRPDRRRACRRARRSTVALAIVDRRRSAACALDPTRARARRAGGRAARDAACRAGVMDQLASVGGRAGHALLLDCRTLEITPVPIPADGRRARGPQRARTPARGQRVRRAPRRVRSRGRAPRRRDAARRDASSRSPTTRSRATS